MTRRSYTPRGTTAREVASDVQGAIRDGLLESGDALPSVRLLARELGISPATVNAAYRELRYRGLLVSDGPRGTRVSLRPPIAYRPILTVPDGVRDVCNGNPDPALLPPLSWALEGGLPGPHLYGQSMAFGPLLERSAADFATSGVDATAQVVVSGAMDGIDRLLSVSLQPGDRVLVEDPTYAELLDLLRAMRLVPVGVPIDGDGPLPEHVASTVREVRGAVLTPRAHNPTGASISAARARQLREVLAAHPDILVIENDHSALVAGAEHCPVATACERWAIVRSVSKAFSPDLRLAVVAGDPSTIALVEARQQLGAGWVSHILQQITHRLWSDPRTEALLARATAVYTDRRTALINALAEHGIAARGRSGLNVYIEVLEEGTAAQAMLTKGWALRTGEGYRLNDRQPSLRATVATLDPDDTRRLAHDLATILQPQRATRAG